MSDVAEVPSRSGERRPIHRLELRAFRPDRRRLHRLDRASVLMHFLVLSTFRRYKIAGRENQVLSRLNLVLSAFPRQRRMALDIGRHVSMHLLVLSAFRLGMRDAHFDKLNMSQCTFWCSVLSDMDITASIYNSARDVSMHLLVLSAFRQLSIWRLTILINMSQCTFWCSVLSDTRLFAIVNRVDPVSMHLLVLSAFRLAIRTVAPLLVMLSQCTFWCSVLSDRIRGGRVGI